MNQEGIPVKYPKLLGVGTHIASFLVQQKVLCDKIADKK
jgi:hypothetical protein